MIEIENIKNLLAKAREERQVLSNELAAKETELNELCYSPVPDAELKKAVNAFIDSMAEQYEKTLLNHLASIRSRTRSYDPDNLGAPRIQRPGDFLEEGHGMDSRTNRQALYFFFSDTMKKKIAAVISEQNWPAGLPTAQRGKKEQALLDNIKVLEEQIFAIESAILEVTQS